MTTIEPYDRHKLQLSWIKGIADQIEFANRPEVLPDFILHLDVRRRKM